MKRQKSNNINNYLLTSILLFFGIFGLAKSSWAASCGLAGSTYYIDYSALNDSGTGTKDSPWKYTTGDIRKSPDCTLQAGDTVVFKKGVSYLSPGTSGAFIVLQSSGSQIVSGSHGTIDSFGVLTDTTVNFNTAGVRAGQYLYIYHSANRQEHTWVESVGVYMIASVGGSPYHTITLSGYSGPEYSYASDMTYMISNPIVFTSSASWGSGDATIDLGRTNYVGFDVNQNNYLVWKDLKFTGGADQDYGGAIRNIAGYYGNWHYILNCKFENIAMNGYTGDVSSNPASSEGVVVQDSTFSHIGNGVTFAIGQYGLAKNNVAQNLCHFGAGNKYWVMIGNTVDTVKNDSDCAVYAAPGHMHLFQVGDNPNYDYGWVIGNKISNSIMNFYFTGVNEVGIQNITNSKPVHVTANQYADVPANADTYGFAGIAGGCEQLNGHLYKIKNFHDNGNGTYEFDLTDLNGNDIDSTLWGTFVKQPGWYEVALKDYAHPAYWTIVNNIVTDDYGAPGGVGHHCFLLGQATGFKIYNNTCVAKSGTMGFLDGIMMTGWDQNIDFENNIFYGTNSAGTSVIDMEMAAWVLGGHTFRNNHYNTNTTTPFKIYKSQADNGFRTLAQWQGCGYDNAVDSFHYSHDLTINPNFKNYPNLDLHLVSSSPDIDVGTNLSTYFIRDRDYVSRPQGSAWDIGAYEYQSGGDTTPPAAPSGLNVQ